MTHGLDASFLVALDTLLAATFQMAGISSVLTLTPADFEVFGHFSCIPVP